MMRFYRHRHPERTFGVGLHEWLVEAGPSGFFFVCKDSDRPSAYDDELLGAFDLIPMADVPVSVRRRAAGRWAAFCRWRASTGARHVGGARGSAPPPR